MFNDLLDSGDTNCHTFQADQPQIPKDKSGSTFSHIFGTNTSRFVAFFHSFVNDPFKRNEPRDINKFNPVSVK